MRRFLLFIVLSVAIMATWTHFFPPPKKVAPRPAPAETATQPAPETPSAAGPAAAAPAGIPAAAAATLPPWASQPVQAAAEQRVVLENDTVRAELTNRGAQLVSFRLKNQRTAQGNPVELVRRRAEGSYPYGLVRTKGLGPHPLDQALFEAQRGQDGRSVAFRYRGPAGVAEKQFRFDGQGFLDVVVNVPGGQGWALLVGPGLGNPTLEE